MRGVGYGLRPTFRILPNGGLLGLDIAAAAGHVYSLSLSQSISISDRVTLEYGR